MALTFGIDAIDLLEVLGESFAGGELLGANQLGHLDCAGETERGGRRFGVKRCSWGKEMRRQYPSGLRGVSAWP